MPIECRLLENAPVPIRYCPKCHDAPFVPFMRGQVQRSKRFLVIGPKRPYCALICEWCKHIVGWESPQGDDDGR